MPILVIDGLHLNFWLGAGRDLDRPWCEQGLMGGTP